MPVLLPDNGFATDLLRKGQQVIMKTLKIMIVASMFAAFLAAVAMVSAAPASVSQDPFDAAGTYKAKCIACHGPKAEKKFDSALPDQQLIDIVMTGKKLEKPPNMPAYGEKGVTADQAKALVEQMKQLKSAP
jgi:mono/diheme cytochrome c family protein